MSSESVAVLGAGNMGTALAQVIAGNGHRVRLWSIEEDVLEEIRDHRRNTRYLDGIPLHEHIEASWELPQAVAEASLVLVSVPSQVVGKIAAQLREHLKPGQTVLNIAKGLEAGTHRRMSEVLKAELDGGLHPAIGSMGGPAIAIEMARGVPMAVIVGIEDTASCSACQKTMQNDHLKVETTTDVCGLEMCATMKNVYAIALGISDGLGYGTNTKAFLASLAIEEMCEISTALGGRRETVFGLAGLGDLLTTGFSEHSRNRTYGHRLGAGGDSDRFLKENTVEGVTAAKAVKELLPGRNHPLLDTVYAVVYEGRDAGESLRHFLRTFSYGA